MAFVDYQHNALALWARAFFLIINKAWVINY